MCISNRLGKKTMHNTIDDSDDDKMGLNIYFNFSNEKQQHSQLSFGATNTERGAQIMYDFRQPTKKYATTKYPQQMNV